MLYPVRESNASLILRRDSFYPSELTRLISECEYSKKCKKMQIMIKISVSHLNANNDLHFGTIFANNFLNLGQKM